jgi:hypothetical protein
MIAADLGRLALVAVMALPGIPLPVLIALLFTVTMVGAPFTAARAAIYPDILSGDRYVLGTAVTQTTSQFAQLAGFASGGLLAGFIGVRTCLLADAATFGASALITRVWIRARPAARREPVMMLEVPTLGGWPGVIATWSQNCWALARPTRPASSFHTARHLW